MRVEPIVRVTFYFLFFFVQIGNLPLDSGGCCVYVGKKESQSSAKKKKIKN